MTENKAVSKRRPGTPNPFNVTVEMPTFTLTEAKSDKFDVVKAVETVATGKASADRVVGQVMWNAALTTYNVVNISKAIGKDKTYPEQNDYARAIGFSKGYVTLLKRLGKCAVELGVQRGSAEWAWLVSNGDKAIVGKVIDGAKTKADLTKGLSPLVKALEADGKLPSASKRGPNREGGTSDDETKADDETAETEGHVATLDEILSGLDKALQDLDDRDKWIAARARIMHMVEREDTLYSKKAATEGK